WCMLPTCTARTASRCCTGENFGVAPQMDHATQQYGRGRTPSLSSLDHLVGAGDECWRQIEADGARSLHVDDELKPVQLLDRELGRIGALEDAIHMRGGATPASPNVVTV